MNIKIVSLLLTIYSIQSNRGTDSVVSNRTSSEIPDGKSEMKYANFDNHNNPKIIESHRELCDQYDSEECASKWFEETNKVYIRNTNRHQNLVYKYETENTDDNHEAYGKLTKDYRKFKSDMLKEADKFKWSSFKNATLKRIFHSIDSIVTNEYFTFVHKISNINDNISSILNNASAQDYNKTDPYEKETNERIVGAWYIYTRNIENRDARKHGFNDAKEFALWKVFEQKNFNETIMKVYYEILPLYQQTHAFFRHCLKQLYPNEFDKDGLIPNHLLSKSIECFGSNLYKNISKEADRNLSNMTVKDMVKITERFFESIGMFKMNDSFWKMSRFVKRENRTVKFCGMTSDLGNGDVRIMICEKTNVRSFYTMYHEMGHAQYMLAYKDLPKPLRNSPIPGFHEAVGDTIDLSARRPEYLKTIGLIKDIPQSNELDIDYLLWYAGFDIINIQKFLWCIFFNWGAYNGSVADDKLNEYWWHIYGALFGMKSSVKQSDKIFYPDENNAIFGEISQIHYFFASICKFTFHESMCKEAGEYSDLNSSKPLHRCNFYGSKKAGKKLLDMMKQGKKQHWTKTMQILTGPAKPGENMFNTRSILKYYKPLYDWLKSKNEELNIRVGW